jgi:hypothetical protein
MRFRLTLTCLALFTALGVGQARAAIEVSILVPATGAHVGDVGAIVPVRIDASADQGIFGVQLLVDGQPYGGFDSSPVDLYRYQVDWNTAGLAVGAHTLAVTATDWSSIGGGVQLTSSPVTVDVGPSYPTIALTAPVPGSSVHGSITIQTTQTTSVGPASVAYAVDGTPVASTTWDTTAVPDGSHSVSATVTDGRGKTATATANVIVANTPLPTPLSGVIVTAPSDYSFGSRTTVVRATVSGGSPPFAGRLIVDGAATTLVPAVIGSTLTFQWETTALAAGSHTLAVGITDASALTATSPPVHVTVDNVSPLAVMYRPLTGPNNGPTIFQVHASDGFGVKSVQFTVDAAPVGSLLTVPDAAGSYLYSITFDTSTLATGAHAVAAIVVDNAGNTATATPVSITTGAVQIVPVLNYHGILGPLDPDPDIYDQSPAQADQELAYLKANGYQSVTIEQYRTWLATGALPAGVTKPVLITVDDGLTDELAWDPLLQKYGFTAVLYVVTGFADNTTPGANDPVANMSWPQIQTLAGNGRWDIAFHAGQYGHAEFSDRANTITVGPGQVQSYAAGCWPYYSCLGTITTTTGTGATRKRTTAAETPAQFQAQVAAEVQTGLAELVQKVPTASLASWACPWNDCGQWTNFYNDPSGAVQSWLPGFFAATFPIVFTQTNPVTYALASGTVGPLNGDHRRYRFEVHTDTTIAQFAAALADAAFAKE